MFDQLGGNEKGFVTKEDVKKLTRDEMRQIVLAFEGTDVSNTLEAEYGIIDPTQLRYNHWPNTTQVYRDWLTPKPLQSQCFVIHFILHQPCMCINFSMLVLNCMTWHFLCLVLKGECLVGLCCAGQISCSLVVIFSQMILEMCKSRLRNKNLLEESFII